MKYLGQIIDDEDLVNKEYVDDEVATKQDTLVSGTNIKTINSQSILGSGNINVGSGGSQTTWWGTSSTTASTTAKVVTCEGFTLTTGALISVYFSTSNTADAPTLNVNSTGAKSIYVGNSVCNGTTNVLKWSGNTVLTFMYDGTYWKYISSVSAGSVASSRGAGTWYGSCSEQASNSAKTSTIANFVLTKGATVSILFYNGNTSDTLTLNINGTGAKTVCRGDSSVMATNPLKWGADEVLTFMYDGTYYRYLSSSCNVGQHLEHIPSATSCTSGRWFQVAYLTLPQGVWLIDCNALFPATNTTGTRQILVTTATSGYNNVTTAPASYGNITRDILQGINSAQYPQSHFPVDVSEETTFRLEAYQGSNTTMNVTGRMYATRLK